MAKVSKKSSNAGKVKITQINTGTSFFKDPETAEQILNHPRFKGKYKADTLESDPPELEETKDTSSAAIEQSADEIKE